MLAWSVPAILKVAGGVAGLRRALAEHGQDVPDRAVVAMWRTRNRLPTQWSAPIVHVLVKNVPNLAIGDLMESVPNADGSRASSDNPFEDETDDLFDQADTP